MTVGRKKDKTYTGYHGVATDTLRAITKLSKTPEGLYGRTSPPFQERLRACIAAGRCPWCDRGPYKVLATHTLRAHAISGAELREMAGFIKTATICDPQLSQKYSAARRGQRLPDAAYERARASRRVFGPAGLAVQRAKLASARSPEQQRRATRAAVTKMADENASKHAEIVRLFADGHLFRDIAEHVGVHARTVRQVLARRGLVDQDGRALRSRNAAFRDRQDRSRAAARTAVATKRDAVASARTDRFQHLGGTWEAVGALAAEWGVSKKSAADFLRKHGAVVPDGRQRGTAEDRGPDSPTSVEVT